ncbi:Ribosomal RNA large subunit methyltransferase J [biofilm metagenome]
MLSYQHAYHAGNYADVLKHIVLIRVLTYLKSKQKPLCYIDTHAGSGSYQLNNAEAQKNREFLNGIGAIWQRENLPLSVACYVEMIRQCNEPGLLSKYPGSPLIASHILDENDRLFFYDLHPAEAKALINRFNKNKHIKIFHGDGIKESLGLLPPKEHRGVVLIDPSYELKTDYQAVVNSVVSMHGRFATGCYLLWYPVVDRKRNRYLERTLQASGIRNIQLFELGIQPDSHDFGMTSSGMIVINPPWTLMADMQQTLPWLAKTLGLQQQGFCRIEQMVGE